MTRRVVIALGLIACLVVGLASDASARRRVHRLHPQIHATSVRAPKITAVRPMKVHVGESLTIKGRNFRKRARVYFLKVGGGVAIARAKSASKRRIVVVVPSRVTSLLNDNGSARFQLRVLTKRFGPIAPKRLAPTVLATDSSTGGTGTDAGGDPTPTCPTGGSADSDNDGLTDDTETKTTHTDPCKADSDGDGIPDGYEYQSALDLNNTVAFGEPDAALPYPGKKPWPNPLDGSDANTDYDGDGLTLGWEYKLNKYVGGPKVGSLQYSDGKQRSQVVAASSDPLDAYQDIDQFPSFNAGVLSDDERDADNDGLGNWDEISGRMTQGWWDGMYNGSTPGFPKETPYPLTYVQVSPIDPDTDGDGVKDGADDQDHDGLSNAFEISRPWDWRITYVSPFHDDPIAPSEFQDATPPGPLPVGVGPNPWARVQPFNPCKPVASETCNLHPAFGTYPAGEDWYGDDPTLYPLPPARPWLYDANDYPLALGEAFDYTG